MQETSKILIDIESLFDLRQAALFDTVDEKEKLATYLTSQEYNFRSIDEFPLVTTEVYKERYNRLDLSLLSKSVITHMCVVLQSKINNLEKRNTYYNEKKIPEVVVNIYPLVLTEVNQEQLQNIIFIKLGGNCMVSIVSLSPANLTPYFLTSSGYISCFMYNFSNWIGIHTPAIEKNPMTDILLYFPSIYDKKGSKEEMETFTKLGFKDIFAYVEYLFASVASINFLPTVFYSNAVTASLYLQRFDENLKKHSFSDSEQAKEIEEMLNKTNFDIKE